jgi:hypothetical protein
MNLNFELWLTWPCLNFGSLGLVWPLRFEGFPDPQRGDPLLTLNHRHPRVKRELVCVAVFEEIVEESKRALGCSD